MPDVVDNSPKVSVVIPTYNRAQTLLASVQSVLQQTFKDFELLIVDDGSTDSTSTLVESIDDDRLRYIALEKNSGASAARNRGIYEARGRYIAFQDSDDEWLPEKLEIQVAALEANPDLAMVFCSLVRIDRQSGGFDRVPSSRLPEEKHAFLKALLQHNFIWTQTWCVRAAVLEAGYLFDEELIRIQDWDLALRLAQNFEVAHIDQVLVKATAMPGSLLSLKAQRGDDLKIMLKTHQSLLRQYPSILSEFYRGIAIANRSQDSAGYWEGCYWSLKALVLKSYHYRAWLTFALALMGPLSEYLLKIIRSESPR